MNISISVANKERPPSATREKATSQGSKAAKSKGKEKGGKDKGSRPPSQQFDFTKPNWLLRVVSDGSAAVCRSINSSHPNNF